MGYLIGVVVLLVVLIGIVLVLKKAGLLGPARPAEADLPYRKNDFLLTKAERSFYEVLIRAIGSEWQVFAKVRLLDLVWLPKNTPNAVSYRNRVQSKHVDFVLCRKDTIGPALVIELNDSSHEAEERRDRDEFVELVFRSAGLPFLSIKAQRAYVQSEIADQVAKAMLAKQSDEK